MVRLSREPRCAQRTFVHRCRHPGEPSLRAIADASGGKFFTARSAEELRQALADTVGTAFEVRRGGVTVASGSLGADEVFRLPDGSYTVRLDSAPRYEVPIRVASEENVTLLLKREKGGVFHQGRRRPAEYRACDAVAGGRSETLDEPLPAARLPFE